MASIPGPGLFRNETVKSIVVWGILAQLLNPILQPLLQEIQSLVFPRFPDTPLSPAEAAAAVVKGHATEAKGESEAAISGIDAERFQLLVQAIQNPPGVGELLELWRRGVIPESGGGADSTSVDQGIREGQTGNKWIGPLKALRYALPSPAQALNALLEGQTDRATAEALYARWGGDPQYFQLLFNTQGQAPTPLEAIEMANRGIIPFEGTGPEVVSYQQAFLEGPWRNKWEGPYRTLAQYVPPPRTVTAMVREGSLSDEQALGYFKAAGMTETLAASYLRSAHNQSVAADRDLTKADILALYGDRLIDSTQATAMLDGLGYSAANATFLLERVDFEQETKLLRSALSRLHSLYLSRKLDPAGLTAALGQLGVPADAQADLGRFWDLERGVSIQVLSAAEIVDLVFYGVQDEAWAIANLQELGYSELDAWLRLQVRLHGAAATPRPAG